MILRKPYALLIRYFRLIHVILTGLMIYVVIKSNLLIRFFNDFIKSGYTVNEINFAGIYINFFMYLTVILILIICITTYFLMKTKEKPTKLYIFTTLYYIFMFIMFSVMHSALGRFEVELIEATTARIYRDLSIIIMIPQLLFIILCAIRAVGFDLKKFNFNKDLQELKIEAKDNEEFEIAVDREDFKLKRNLRRNYREFKYYLIEYKFILLCIGFIFITIIGTSIYFNVAVYNKKYNIDQSFVSNNLKTTFGNSYLTNLAYNGNILSKDKYYLVVNVKFENLSTTKKIVELENYRLLIDNKIIIPTITRNEYFVDLGIPYNKEKFVANSTNDRLIIFEIDKKDINNKYTIRTKNSINVKVGDIQVRYSETIVEPVLIDKTEIKSSVNLNEKLSFENLIAENSYVLIKKYEITRYYKYNYNFCLNANCSISTGIITPNNSEYNQTLLILEGEFNFNEESFFYKNIKNSYPMFAKIVYTKNNITKTIPVKNVTPNNVNDKIILQTYNGIENADELSFVYSFRDEEYVIKLK